jgi:signal transduction histidine kinase
LNYDGAFPDNSDDPHATGVASLPASLERVRAATGARATLPCSTSTSASDTSSIAASYSSSPASRSSRQKVAMILKASNHLLGIVDEVLDTSRVEEGTLSVSAEAIAVQPLIDDAVDLTRPLAESTDVVIHDPKLSGGNGCVFASHRR